VTDQISYRIGDRLYLNITDRCTLECRFCPKTLGRPEVQGYDLALSHRPTVEEIIASIGDPARYAEVVFCGYGEPTLRLNVLLQVARWVKAHGAASGSTRTASRTSSQGRHPPPAGRVRRRAVRVDERPERRDLRPALPAGAARVL